MSRTADLIQLHALMRRKHQLQAKNSLLSFTTYTKADYSVNWHHKLVCDALDKFERGEIKKLAIALPPQTGKSELSSRRFPAYALGKNPDRKIALCSYGAEHAQAFNRDVQRIIDNELYTDIFKGTFLNASNAATDASGGYKRTANIFETVGRNGFLKTVGIGGALTGTPVDIGIIDDAFKDRKEAESKTIRKNVWDWYTDVFESRLHNDSQQLALFTRWHMDDLIGRILDRDGKASEGGEWHYISLPALREDMSDPDDPREIGEALWEVRHSRERMKKIKATKAVTFASLYQQRPAPAEGNKIKRSWFEYCLLHEVPQGIIWDLWIDGAYTASTANDPTGLMVAGFHKPTNRLFIRHAKDAYLEMPALLKLIPEYAAQHGLADRSRCFIEPKASGKSLKQMINSLGLGLSAVEIQSTLVREGKEARAQVAAPKIEAGQVVLVKGAWNSSVVDQLCTFPNHPHDEYVDLGGYACDNYFLKKPRRGKRTR